MQLARIAQTMFGVAIVLFALFWMYLYTPDRDEVIEMQARLETLEQSNRRAQITAARGACAEPANTADIRSG